MYIMNIIKNVCLSHWVREISANNAYDTGLVSRMYNVSQNSVIKKKNNQGGEDVAQ